MDVFHMFYRGNLSPWLWSTSLSQRRVNNLFTVWTLWKQHYDDSIIIIIIMIIIMIMCSGASSRISESKHFFSEKKLHNSESKPPVGFCFVNMHRSTHKFKLAAWWWSAATMRKNTIKAFNGAHFLSSHSRLLLPQGEPACLIATTYVALPWFSW